MRNIGYDQVAWLCDVLERYRTTSNLTNNFPLISRVKEAAMASAIIEISEILGCTFENKKVLMNCFSGICEVDENGK